MLRKKLRLHIGTAAAVLTAGLLAAACSSSGTTAAGGSTQPTHAATGSEIKGGTVTYALPPQVTINYIFPFMSITTSSVYNANQFQYLMYTPLYMFGGDSATSVTANY